MKLNKKGLKRLLDVAFDGDEFYQSNALEVEFEPDDFDGGCFQNGKDHLVRLTVEEAKGILWDLRDLYKQTYGYEWVKNEPWFDEFKKRIEKAEGK